MFWREHTLKVLPKLSYNMITLMEFSITSSQIIQVVHEVIELMEGLKGEISFVNNKPVIGGRFNFWQGFETIESLASKLNSMSTDIHSSGIEFKYRS